MNADAGDFDDIANGRQAVKPVNGWRFRKPPAGQAGWTLIAALRKRSG